MAVEKYLKEDGDFITLEDGSGSLLLESSSAEAGEPFVQVKAPLIFGFQTKVPSLRIRAIKGGVTFNKLFPLVGDTLIKYTMSKSATTRIPIKTQIVRTPIIREIFNKVGSTIFGVRYLTEGSVKLDTEVKYKKKRKKRRIKEFLKFLDILDD